MQYITHSKVHAIIIVLIILSPTFLSFKPEPASPSLQSIPGKQIILRAKPEDIFFRVSSPSQVKQSKTPTAIITVNYIGAWDPSAQIAFQHAVDIWASLLVSSVPIEIEAEWSSLASDILGGAGPAEFYRNFPNAPRANVWYSAALANALSNNDRNDGDPEILAEFNRNFSNWYFGTDGNPPPGKYDFVSVVLHEIGHGLGFFGTADIFGGQGIWGFGFPSHPDTYDPFVENSSGQKIIDFPSPSTTLSDQLRGSGGGLFFSGAKAKEANNGSRPQLYAPSTWEPGSSYAHLDEEVYERTVNALMTPAMGSAEAIHDPGPITLGIFQDMGWTINPPPPSLLPDLIVTQHLQNSDLSPGDPVTIVLTVENKGDASAADVVLTDSLPPDILTPSWTSSASLTGTSLRGGTIYVWDLPNLAAGVSGTLTINGTLDPNLPHDFTLINQATVSTPDKEANLNNNSSALILGGKRVYLPVIY